MGQQESPPTLFGRHYDYKQIKHVCSAFFDTAYALRDVAETVDFLNKRRAAERNTPEFARVVRWYRRRWRLNWMPDLEGVGQRIANARSAIDRLRPALYVAEHGPIFLPFRHIQDRARTIFDRVLDRLDEIVGPLTASIPAEWQVENYEAWDALKPRARCAKMLPVYLAAAQASHHPVITTDTQMHVDEMWKVAQIAHRLMETLGQAHQPLLDGSLLLAEMGYLASASVNFGGQIDDSYPVADRFPRDFNEAEDWRRYASLLQRFKGIAPLVGVTDLDVNDALCAAEQLALAHHELATRQCDQAAVDRAAGHLDRVQLNQAYWRIGRAIGDRLRSLIPDRGQMWAEAFGRWASDVSTQDAAMLEGVLPATVDENPAPSADASNAAAPIPATLQNRVRECEAAIGRYAALRPELFRQLPLVPKGWKVQYKRDPAKGDPSLPVKVTYHTAIVNEIGGQPFDGIATVTQPETYADFHDFALLDPDGNGTKPGTETATVEMRLAFLLGQLLDVMKVLAGALSSIEREAKALGLQTDTTVLSRLAIHLPVFPYWPTLKGMAQADWDKIIAEEKPLLDEALLTLRRLELEAGTSTKPTGAPALTPQDRRAELSRIAAAFHELAERTKAKGETNLTMHAAHAGKLLAKAMDNGAWADVPPLRQTRAEYFDQGKLQQFLWVSVRRWLLPRYGHLFMPPVLGLTSRHLATSCKLLGDLADAAAKQIQVEPPVTAAVIPANGAPAEPQTAQAPAKRLSKEAKALAALADHPDWTDEQIAQAAGCKRQSLYRMQKFVAAKRLLKDGKDSVAVGTKDRKTGAVEAWDGGRDDDEDDE